MGFADVAPSASAPSIASEPSPKKRARKLKRPLSAEERQGSAGAAPQEFAKEEAFAEELEPVSFVHDADDEGLVLRDLGELVAKLLLHRDGSLVITFRAPEALVWTDLGTLMVEFEDGSRWEVSLVTSGSTFGLVQEGSEVRMVLAGLPSTELPRPVTVHVNGSIRLRLTL